MASLGSSIRGIRSGLVDTLTEERAEDFIALAERVGQDPAAQAKIKEFFHNGWYTETVDRIRDGGVRDVFDVMNSATESYVTDGAISHNCWQNQTLLESYRSFILAENYLEHVQVPVLSKGKVLDAVAWVAFEKDNRYREDIPTVFVDALIATDKKKHPHLVQAIMRRELKAVSMGADITHFQCSRCGKIFVEGQDDPCKHLELGQGMWYPDAKTGEKRRCAEMCGVPGLAGSNTFTELSGVADQAFGPAILHDFLREVEPAYTTGIPMRAFVPGFRALVAAEE